MTRPPLVDAFFQGKRMSGKMAKAIVKYILELEEKLRERKKT